MRAKPHTRDRRWLIALAAIFFLAFAPRAVVAMRMDQPPNFNNDAGWYDLFGKQIAAGNGYTLPFGEPTAVWPPGYPIFLGGVYKAFDDSQQAARLANALLGALTAVFAAELGRRLFGFAAGAAAGAVMALLPGHIFFTPLLMSEVLFTALIAGGLLLGLRARTATSAALSGIVFGAAMLTRPQGILLVLALIATWWAFGYARGDQRARTLAMIGVMVVAAAAVVTPWSVRNSLRLNAFVPVSTNLGINLWIGNNPDANGGFAPGDTARFEQQVAGLPRPDLEVEYDRLARRAALEYIAEHPGQTVSRWPRKVYETYKDDAAASRWYQPLDADYLDDDTEDRIDLVSNIYWYALLALAAVGAVVTAARRASGVVLPAVGLVVWTAVSLVFFAEPRFHVPVYPLFAVLAGAAIAALLEAASNRVPAFTHGPPDDGAHPGPLP